MNDKEILKELNDRYWEARNELYNVSIEMSLAKSGIDTTKVSKKDIDQIRRLNFKIEDVKEKENRNILKVQQEAQAEIVEIHAELDKINVGIRKAQGLPLSITKEELVKGTEDESKAETDSGANNQGTPEPDRKALQES